MVYFLLKKISSIGEEIKNTWGSISGEHSVASGPVPLRRFFEAVLSNALALSQSFRRAEDVEPTRPEPDFSSPYPNSNSSASLSPI